MTHPKIEGRTPCYKLVYFNGRGLGEGARLLFHYAGVPFKDIRIEMDKWPTLKATTPFGQLPTLEVDGHVIAQSGAIYRFLGHQFDLVPKCPFEAALADSIFDAHKDFHEEIKPFRRVAFGFDKGDKDKLEKEVFLPARDKYFKALNKFLEKTGEDHLVGKSISWVDIVIADNLSNYQEYVPSMFDEYPAVKKFVDSVIALPNIKKYISERHETKF